MKITYWGTAAAEGIPSAYCSCPLCEKARSLGGKNIRTRAQMLIDDQLLVDLGPDTFSHSLQYHTNLVDIRDILITHSHSDHFYGEDLLFRAEPYGHGGLDWPATLHGNQKVGRIFQDIIKTYNDSQYLDRCVRFHEIQGFIPFEAGGYLVTPLPTVHDFAEECFIFEILSKIDGKRLLYGNDSAYFPSETMAYLEGRRFDLISLDCTMGGAPECASHMSMAVCVRLAARLREQKTADEGTVIIVTHFSHNNGLLHEELSALGEKHGFVTAYDGMSLTL